jgi:putative transposase
MRQRRPRLNPSLYIGLQRYFLTFCTAQRHACFITMDAVKCVRDQILQVAALFDMEEIAYCFMPDHVHLLVEGHSEASDALAFVHRAKQLSGYEFSRMFGRTLWQPSFNDRILRDDEATLSVARYIFENPVRAGLVKNPEDYPFLGSAKYSTREIMEAICWQP